MKTNDKTILRDLSKQYAAIAARPVNVQRRTLWRSHFSLQRTATPIVATFGLWQHWCQEYFSDDKMKCQDPLFRHWEKWFHLQFFHDSIDDDFVFNPWLTLCAVYTTPESSYGEGWGLQTDYVHGQAKDGAWKLRPPIEKPDDLKKLMPPRHLIDEQATSEAVNRLQDAVGDILEIDVYRGPVLLNYGGDISTTVGALRGIEQLMMDMYDSPQWLHSFLAILRDGILENQRQAEEAGDFFLTCNRNQAMPYAEDLEEVKANSGPRKRNELWDAFAAQEYTLVSPEFHEEFLLDYQKPIMEQFGLVHYGCCEDLSRKIDLLRTIPNLRSIAVPPSANVESCAEQIGSDYAISWRPNPAEMVCTDWDEDRIRNVLQHGLRACRNGICHILLHNIETLKGQPDRLARWCAIARSVAQEVGG